MPGRRLRFGPFEVDESAQVVLRDGNPLPVGKRGVTLLATLLRRPGEVVTKTELIDAAWGGAAVEESNLSVQVAALRKALGPMPSGSDWIATISRVGYRLVGVAGSASAAPAHKIDKTIAVLPFENISNDPDQTFFADGLAEELITALSKVRGLVTIARTSSFAYRGAAVDVRKVAEELDVACVLAGSVRRSGNRVRMSAQLADGATGGHLWAETYDRELADVFAIQDEVARHIVTALQMHLTNEDYLALSNNGTRSIEALDCFQRGYAQWSQPDQDPETNQLAAELFKQALALDPAYPQASSMLIVTHMTSVSNGWTNDPAIEIGIAREVAGRALALRPDHVESHLARALVAMIERDHETMRVETEAAMRINPSSGGACLHRAGYLVSNGEAAAAIPLYEHAIRLDPAMTHLYIHHLATAHFHAQCYETAAALFRSRIVMVPRTDMSRGYLCACLGHLGRLDEARQVWAELMAINPTYSISARLARFYFADAAYPARVEAGLTKAGLPY